MSDSPATIAAARKLGPRPALTRNAHGKLVGPLPTAAEDKIVREWIDTEDGAAFRIGNVAQLADARTFLRGVAEQLGREPARRCTQALHTMLSDRMREMAGDPREVSPQQAKFLLTECKHPMNHRGRHRSEDGKASWTGKLNDDEMSFADALRALIREDDNRWANWRCEDHKGYVVVHDPEGRRVWLTASHVASWINGTWDVSIQVTHSVTGIPGKPANHMRDTAIEYQQAEAIGGVRRIYELAAAALETA